MDIVLLEKQFIEASVEVQKLERQKEALEQSLQGQQSRLKAVSSYLLEYHGDKYEAIYMRAYAAKRLECIEWDASRISNA